MGLLAQKATGLRVQKAHGHNMSELKRLANPSSADSIPSSAMQEDHVSMGWSAARKLRKAVDGLQRVLAIEILTAARAIDMREGTPAKGTGAVITKLRETVKGPGVDRYLSPEIEETVRLVKEGALVEAVENATGKLRD
ncbi:aromatic amino acid lyase [Corynebacterium striatum]|uniref:aromatic amino acid lyase n=1 Tax=Corynebacterium striatum TaxID=43770 RepID=UPI00254CBFEE|nr:aromatic amino acid lyase [Corynebacterium striatum]MDK8878001.1 aromatic amino acid lyase [Corynebacterium striatum]